MTVVRAGRAAGMLLSVLVLAACGSGTATAAAMATAMVTSAPATSGLADGEAELSGTSWVLVGYTSPTGERLTVPNAIAPTLVFGVGTLDGVAGCNRFSGTWSLDREVLTLGNLTWTEAGCPEPGATVEKAYLANLALVDRAIQNGENLVVRQSDGFATLEFLPAGV
jgi:heat shock protein HslJ